MLKSGFIKINREIINWKWYKNPITKSMFLHILLQANYEAHGFENITIERGEFVSSYPNLAKDLGITVMQARTAINHLKSTGEITAKSYPKFTVFSVVNYDMYQTRQRVKQQASNSQITGKQQSNNNNERKNKERIKKEKEYFSASAQIDWTLSRNEIIKLIDWDNLDKYSDDERIRIARL